MEYTKEMKQALLQVAEEHLDDCGCCGEFHTRAFFGDCRDDSNRIGLPDDLVARWLAAGDMYEALEAVLEHLPDKDVDGSWDSVNAILIEKALAKAEVK